MPFPCLIGSVLQGRFGTPIAGRVAQARLDARGTVQRRPGMEAFQVNLAPKSGGWPIPRDLKSKMESALGSDFSDVRIHVGPEASSIGAIAFTWGSNIHFAPGQYNPNTFEGQSLLGHELAHVVQQRAGRVANPFGSGVAVVQDQALEAEADRLGRQAAMSRVPAPAKQGAGGDGALAGSGGSGGGMILRKVKTVASYSVRAPQPERSGWRIQVAAQGVSQPVGSVQLTAKGSGVYISDLKVSPEHRRHGVAGQLINAALSAARTRGFPVAQLEARPDSPADVAPAALVSMYQRLGFRMNGLSARGNPLMERST